MWINQRNEILEGVLVAVFPLQKQKRDIALAIFHASSSQYGAGAFWGR
jgi:hypothetical protein